MICKVISTIEKYALLEGVSSVAVGVSGGADSVCLLHILTSLRDKYGITLKVAHVNHNLRGDEALRDECFVRELCRKLNVDLQVFSVDIKAEAEKLGIGEEECGRNIRYRCFAELGCDAVAVAHSLSDSIETMLFNLARGTVIKGLCGIPVKRAPNIIRPLIECTREEIEAYCEENNLEYVTDSTNLTCDYMRNHIRHKIIPDISYINGAYQKNIGRCMTSLSEDSEYLDLRADELLKKACTDSGYKKVILFNAHKAIRKRVLHRILDEHMNKDVDSRHIALFERIISGECDKAEIGTDLYITAKDGIVSVGAPAKEIKPWECTFTDARAVTPMGNYILLKSEVPCKDSIDADMIEGDLYISSRKEGDRFTFYNRKVTKSLKKLFNEMKIPSEVRNSIAVLHDEENVIWVEGVGVNARYIPKKETKEFLIIKKEG